MGRGGLSILRWLLPVIFTTIIEIAMGKAHLLLRLAKWKKCPIEIDLGAIQLN